MRIKSFLFTIIAVFFLCVPAEAKIRVYFATGLTGGTTGSLDNIDASNALGDTSNIEIVNGDVAVVIVPDDQTYFYQLDADSGLAESSPDIIAPDDNAGNKRWILTNTYIKGEVPISKFHGTSLDTLAEVVAAISTTETTLVIDEAISFGAATTTPSTLSVKVLPGADVTTTGYTLTTNGPLENNGSIIGTGTLAINSEYKGSGTIATTVTVTPGVTAKVEYFSPDMFGAAGDGSTDDYDEIQAAVDAIKSNVAAYASSGFDTAARIGIPLKFMPGRVYKTETSIFIGGSSTNCVKSIEGNGAVLYGATDGTPIIDATGAQNVEMDSVLSLEGDVTAPPNVGWLAARISTGATSQNQHLKLNILGDYTVSGIYNYGSEEFRYEVIANINAGLSCVILTENNSRSITSANATIATGSQSSTSGMVIGSFTNAESTTTGTNASVFEIDSWQNVHFGKVFFNTGTDDKPLVWVRATGTAIPHSLTFDAPYCHAGYLKAFQIDVGVLRKLTIKNAIWGLTSNTTQVVFGAGATVYNSEIHAPNIDASAANCDFYNCVLDASDTICTSRSLNVARIFKNSQAVVNEVADLTIGSIGNWIGSSISAVADGVKTRIPWFHAVSSTASDGTGEDTLKTDTLDQDGMPERAIISVYGQGTITNANGNKTIKFYFGSTAITVIPAENLANGAKWHVEAKIFFDDYNTQRATAVGYVEGIAKGGSAVSTTEDFSAGDITVKFTGECANASDIITQTHMRIDIQ